MKKAIICLVLGVAALTSCSSLYVASAQNESSGLIGCHPKDITIESHDFTGQTWTATCKNTKFYCSTVNEVVNCKEAL